MEEVAEHNSTNDCWIVIEGRVYDLSKWLNKHPGGLLPILNLAGKDSTDAFMHNHPAEVWEKLPWFHIADVHKTSGPIESGFRELRQILLDKNLFKTDPFYYVKKSLFLAIMFMVMLYLALHVQTTIAIMVSAFLLGLFWQQLSFIGHDTGHNAITHIQVVDSLLGIFVGNFMGGISIGWWKRSHNVHHIVTNSIEHDPDVQHLPMLAIHKDMFSRFYSSYHSKWIYLDTMGRALISYQHLLYYPIMGFARFNLYVQSLRLLLSAEHVPYKRLELVASIGFILWFTSLVRALPTSLDAFIFLLISHFVSGVLHLQITLSHFPMPVHHGRSYTSDSDGWFATQIHGSMNIKSNWLTDWFYGGLQFQIEHHLFPRLPRHNLRAARALVKPFAARHGIPYVELGFWDANKKCLATLRAAAYAAREADVEPWPVFFRSMLWDTMNAIG